MQSASKHSLEKRPSASAIETAVTPADPLNPRGESGDAKSAAVSIVAGPKFEVPNLDKLFLSYLITPNTTCLIG